MNTQSSSLSTPFRAALSLRQLHVWQAQQLNPTSPVFNVCCALRLTGEVSQEAMTNAYRKLLQRHTVLTSVVTLNDDNPCLTLAMNEPLITSSLSFNETTIQPYCQSVYEQVMDIHTQLFELHQIKMDEEWVVVFKGHHLICDQWSLQLIVSDFLTFLEDFLARGIDQTRIDLPEVFYPEFISVAQEELATINTSVVVDELTDTHSTGTAAEPSAALYSIEFFTADNLLSANNASGQQTAPSFSASARLDDLPEEFALISELSSTLAVSRFSVVLSSVLMSLYKTTGLTELTVGIPVARRTRKNRYQVGHFVDLAPVSLTELNTQTPQALIQAVSEQVTGFLFGRNQFDMAQVNVVCNYLPLLNIKGIKPHLLPLIAGLPGHSLTLGDEHQLTVSGITINPSIAQYDLEFTLFEAAIPSDVNGQKSPNALQLIRKVIGAKKLFNAASLKRISQIQQRYLALLPTHLTKPLSSLDVIAPEEKTLLLETWNQTCAPFPEDKTLMACFEAQVAKTPEHIAIVFEQEQLSYRALNARANQLAYVLRAQYVEKYQQALPADTLVAVYVDRSIEMMVAILGILKAGAAYVPISPEYPQARTQYILQDTQAPFVITQSHYQQTLTEFLLDQNENEQNEVDSQTDISEIVSTAPNVVALTASLLDSAPAENISINRSARDLAYVIYTSGTTGQPKGVMLEHQAVVNRIYWMQKEYQLGETDVVLQKTPYIFDVSVWELFWPHWVGATMVIATPEIHKDPEKLATLITKTSVTTLHFVPSMLSAFCQSLIQKNQSLPEGIKQVFCSGEALSLIHVKEFMRLVTGDQYLHNLYGPTEAAIDVTYADCSALPDNIVPIGKAIDNIQLFVLNPQMQPVPVGCPGELYIGGVGLARGYLNQPTLTQERFVVNPFANEKDEALGYNRLYKTGDLVRYRQDGTLVYLGRNDFQVKIRGFRIELGEIETAICQHPSVSQAVVLGYPLPNPTSLIAYVVPSRATFDEHSTPEINTDELLQSLRTQLPDYMLPDSFNCLDSLPLTLNGKLDRKALPEPVFTQKAYVAPRNDTELALADIWQSVLGIDRIGIHDNFFRIGGNSITAIKLTAASRSALGRDIPLTLLFEHKTIAGVVAHLDHVQTVTIPNTYQAQPVLSFAQERLLFIERYEQGTSAYHIPMMVKLKPTTDLSVMTHAFNQLIQRYPVLKTCYRENDHDQNYQAFSDDVLTIKTVNCHEDTLVEQVKAEIAIPFDLSQGLALRVSHYHGEQHDYLLILCHHIAFDGWSIDIFMQSLTALYALLIDDNPPALNAYMAKRTDISYADYAYWQRQYLQGDKLNELLSYWQTQLSGYETLALPTDYRRPAEFDYRGEDVHFTLDSELSAQLRALAKTQETTLYSVLLSGFYLALGSLSGQTDIIVGTPSDNRHHAQTQELIGFFVNSLVLRAQLHPEQSINSLIQQVHQTVLDAKIHQDLPFERLVEALDVERDPARHPIFQVMFSVQSFGEGGKAQGNAESSAFEAIDKSLESAIYNPAKFDLSLFINDFDTEISADFTYATQLFNQQTINNLQQMYVRILQYFVEQVQLPLNQIQLVSDKTKQLLLTQWHHTAELNSANATLHQLFEAQVELTPDAIALRFDNQTLTYLALNQRANLLASHIRASYQKNNNNVLSSDTLIALYLDRSFDMVISILAVLKAGAAYIPLSPEFPKSRCEFILDDVQASFLLTSQNYSEKVIEFSPSTAIIYVDKNYVATSDADCENDAQLSEDNLSPISGPDDLAYVIYTSGTTGQPKGVAITHRASADRNLHMTKIGETAKNRYLFKTNYIFDVSVSDLFSHLFCGAEVIITKSIFEPNEIQELITIHNINACHFVPSQFSALNCDENLSLEVERIYFSGEKLTQEQLSFIDLANTKVINYYGPTETGEVTYHKVSSKDAGSIIGKPFPGCQVYVVQLGKQLAPIGAPGELYVGGAGLARGYLTRPELTKERFIDNPFAQGRLYKTGDLVRWLPNGELEYLGRNDCQVKIRGYRIELGEIESALVQLGGIKQAVVVTQGTGDSQCLVAYIVLTDTDSKNTDNFGTVAINGLLSAVLPDYMLPVAYTVLDEMPLTLNGKLDKNALPSALFNASSEYQAPRTPLESTLVDIWQDILAREQVSIHDNFFAIGGNSITAIRLTSACQRALSQAVPLALLFEHKTIAALATALAHSIENNSLDNAVQTIPHQQLTDDTPRVLSFAQERLFFIERFEPGVSAYHIPYVAELLADCPLERLSKAVNIIARRHPILKTVYQSDDEGVNDGHDSCYVLNSDIMMSKQALLSSEKSISTLPLKTALNEAIQQQIAKPFDLTTEPSMRMHCISQADKRYVVFVWHHIAFDGWSAQIFMKELAEIYQALTVNANAYDQTHSLPATEIVYADYAQWQKTYLQGDVLTEQLDYWQQQLSGYQTLALPTDFPRPAQFDYQGQNIDFHLPESLSAQLNALAQAQETTLYTVLLSAFYLTLSALSGQDDIVIGTPSDNRHHAQTQDIIGFFVNSLALRATINHSSSISDFIQQVHQIATQAKVHQELPFEKLLDSLQVERDTSRHPLFQVMFSVQNFSAGTELLEGSPFRALDVEDSFEQDDGYSPAKFDLSLILSEGEQAISGEINFASGLFTQKSMQRLLAMYRQVLTAWVETPEKTLVDVEVLLPAERHQLITEFNQTDKPYAQHETLSRLFDQQVARTPDKIALVFEGDSLSYRELQTQVDIQAKRIRHSYQQHHQKPLEADTLIVLYLERSLEMVISQLAVLKAGAAYVPVSPDYPKARSCFILEDTQAPLMIASGQYTAQLDSWLTEAGLSTVILTAEGDNSLLLDNQQIDTSLTTKSTDLAYVIYTSGTTGQPKGVMIEHKSVINLIEAQIERFSLRTSQRSLLFAANVFDASVFELYVSLHIGHTLYLCNDEERTDAEKLTQLIQKNNIQVATLPPALINVINSKDLRSLNTLILAGESPMLNVMKAYSEHCQVYNAYGPTESTVCSTAHPFKANDLATNIGAPLANTRIFVLNSTLKPVPIGTPGDLYVGGAVLARGYLNRETLTQERFIDNPFMSQLDEEHGYNRLYKTGDRVRWLANNELEYLGRDDFQVKIHGFRIELSEIENALLSCEGIKQAIVIDHTETKSHLTQSRTYLCAYYVCLDNHSLDVENLRIELSKLLPKHMIPESFNELAIIPLTINGKVDKKALPAPTFTTATIKVSPRDPIEQILADIWQKLLGIKNISIYDNFFHIGGDSIMSMQLVSRLRNKGFSLQAKEVFDNPTLISLAKKIQLNGKPIAIEAEQGELSGTYGLLPIQQWFFDNKFESATHWNQAFALKIPTSIKTTDIGIALQTLQCHHDVLRSSFIFDNNETISQSYQELINTKQPKLHHLSITHMTDDEISEQLTQWQSQFNFETGELWCAVHMTSEQPNDNRLFFAFHHLIIDTVSWRIIAEDVEQLLKGETLPDKTSSYRQWVNVIAQYSEQHPSEMSYWQQKLIGEKLITSYQNQHATGIRLSAKHTELLLRQSCNAFDTDIQDLLLTALSHALSSTFKNYEHYITLEGHGRELLDKTLDISRTVGWFTSVYPVKLTTHQDILKTLIQTKEMLKAIPNNGIGFGAFRQRLDKNLPQISFNYLGQMNQSSSTKMLADWQITHENCGVTIDKKNHDPFALTLNGAIMQGQLQFRINAFIDEQQTEQFANYFESILIELINETAEQAQKTMIRTFSDIDKLNSERYIQTHPLHEKAPIFCFPPGNGGVESYLNNIVPELTEQPLVLFNNMMTVFEAHNDSDSFSFYRWHTFLRNSQTINCPRRQNRKFNFHGCLF